MRVGGILLCGGQSLRMGEPKAWLPFGEERLLDVMRRARDVSPRHIVRAVLEEVQRFSGDQQRDDVTLIVARCRSREAARPQPRS